jgi:hypothetical protein
MATTMAPTCDYAPPAHQPTTMDVISCHEPCHAALLDGFAPAGRCGQ